MLHNALARGQVYHRRLLPKPHSFNYRVYMSLLDLDALDAVFQRSPWWSLERFNLVSFRRSDYLHSPLVDLKAAVLEKALNSLDDAALEQEIRSAPDTVQVWFLGHLRQWGYCFNPVSFYFITRDDQLLAMVAEINNTPWDERHCYVLPVAAVFTEVQPMSFRFPKSFHVSPFMPMDMDYVWRLHLQPGAINIHMGLEREGQAVFNAGIRLSLQPMESRSMAQMPLRYPLITLRTSFNIYRQALLLRLKKIPFFSHPGHREKAEGVQPHA